ncbi:MAG TPA: UDP-3-O-(3-hydroxymyristoyl)glucosamine N-acyltransferase [Flavobacteriales bacterium]|nr:UDP-3-O-(3-hydroxymyristoyl)glucosamine N-acyltransferase [Flavobacteriales bacterium]HNU55094.1 UDP-3-O-(3-hydroxymyristoyl)glucosamine N-acyltransferase [Flavobacteriales bacterium]
MEFTADQIAQLLQGTVEGDANAAVRTLSRIEEGGEGSLSFLANPAYAQYLYSTTASVVIIGKDFQLTGPVSTTLVRVADAQGAFARVLEMYNTIKLDKKGISPQAVISAGATHGTDCYVGALAFVGENVKLGNNVRIYPHAYIGDNVTIGDGTTIFANVTIYSDCVIGARCIIHSGTVIGSDGFRFATGPGGGAKIPQIGNVVIEDEVEIGANCAIDRATLGSTILRKGVKFDNLIHIAHNVEVGENTYYAAGGVVAGSTKIGRNCMFSGQVGIIGHLKIADGTIVAAQSGISKNTKAGEAYMGSPAYEVQKYRKSYIHFRNLDRIVERLERLEKGVD